MSDQDIPRTVAATNAKHVTLACDPCRSAKRKCTGVQPCTPCVKRDIPCVFSQNVDGRRRAALKRKVEDLENDADLLTNLLIALHDNTDEQVKQIVTLIRSNPSLDEVKTCVQQELIQLRLSRREASPDLELVQDTISDYCSTHYTPSFPSGQPAPKRTSNLSIARLIDDPPIKVPSQPWTDVTTDDTLVSHIISAWMMWEMPFYNWIDTDPFIHEMQAGKIGTRFCSPFLVNALMGYACTFGDYVEVKAERGGPSRLMNCFIDKAKSLIPHEDDDEDLLTLAQGLMMMFLAESIAGRDGSAFKKYALRAGRICKRLELKYAHLNRSPGSADSNLVKAVSTCCWGIYNMIMMTSWIYHQSCPIEPPAWPWSLPEIVRDEREWTPYPSSGPSQPSYNSELLHHRSALSLIIKDLAIFSEQGKDVTQSAKQADSIQRAHDLLDRFLRWRSDLPPHLQVTAESPPPILIHQAYYLCLLISLCSSEMPPESEKSWTIRAQTVGWQATIDVVEIFRIYNAAYGNTHTCVFLVHPLLMVLDMLLNNNEAGAYNAEVIDLCVFFRAMSRRFPFAFAVLRMFQLSTREAKKALPPETEKLFEDFYASEWVNRQLEELESHYPVDKMKILPPHLRTPQNLGDFISMLDNLKINDTEQGSSTGQAEETGFER